jgi:uncharacterized protein DUF7007
MRTPWGESDSVVQFDNGIRGVSTPSHGGYWVPAKLLSRIPQRFQDYAARWSNSPQWYEEDCAWACVAVTFPDLACNGARQFSAADLQQARETIARYIDKPADTRGTGFAFADGLSAD